MLNWRRSLSGRFTAAIYSVNAANSPALLAREERLGREQLRHNYFVQATSYCATDAGFFWLCGTLPA
jgi:hypothetical protein